MGSMKKIKKIIKKVAGGVDTKRPAVYINTHHDGSRGKRSLTAKGRKEETKMRGETRAAARVHETENTCGASRKGAPNEPDPADAGVDP